MASSLGASGTRMTFPTFFFSCICLLQHSELLLLFVQGVDLKHQPALPGRAYKSKQLDMGTSPLYRQGTQTPGSAGTVLLLPSRAFLWVIALPRWVWTPGLCVRHGDLLSDLPMSRQISGGKQGAEREFPMSLSSALVSDHLIFCSESVVLIPSLLFSFFPFKYWVTRFSK